MNEIEDKINYMLDYEFSKNKIFYNIVGADNINHIYSRLPYE